jgi:hypothetical protein
MNITPLLFLILFVVFEKLVKFYGIPLFQNVRQSAKESDDQSHDGDFISAIEKGVLRFVEEDPSYH